jgi:hypothetical protein
MNDTKNLRLQIAQLGESILGDNLLGFQVGNEPDLYGRYVRQTPNRNVLLTMRAFFLGMPWEDVQ